MDSLAPSFFCCKTLHFYPLVQFTQPLTATGAPSQTSSIPYHTILRHVQFSSVQFSSVQSYRARWVRPPSRAKVPHVAVPSTRSWVQHVLMPRFETYACPQCLPSDTVPIRHLDLDAAAARYPPQTSTYHTMQLTIVTFLAINFFNYVIQVRKCTIQQKKTQKVRLLSTLIEHHILNVVAI